MRRSAGAISEYSASFLHFLNRRCYFSLQEKFMATSIDEAKLKELLKSAVAEVLEERRELVKEIVEEALEDVALTRAIDEGVGTSAVSREEVFTILESAQ
jgi:methionyl-tRNA synthetase